MRSVLMAELYCTTNHIAREIFHAPAVVLFVWQDYTAAMNWQQVVKDLRAAGLTFQAIADQAGMSKGNVHDLMHGRQLDVMWSRGESLLRLHRQVMRRRLR